MARLPRVARSSHDVELWRRAQSAGFTFTFVPRLSGIKFPAASRRDVYKTRPAHEQKAWLARIDAEPDLELTQLVSFVAGAAVPSGLRYRDVVALFTRQTVARFRMRLAGVVPWFPFRRRSVEQVRRFKGL